MPLKRIVLVGAGYSHLFCVRHAGEFTRQGHELTLVAPPASWYSGLASGVLGGVYPKALDRIGVEDLCRRHGATLISGAAAGIDLEDGCVNAGAGAVRFDLLSLAVGSVSRSLPGEAEDRERCFSAKPIERLLEAGEALEGHFAKRRAPRVVVAGGGLSGFEIAAGLLSLAARHAAGIDLTVLAGTHPLLELPSGARNALIHSLVRRGAEVIAGESAAKIEGGHLVTDGGSRLPFDIFVNATGSVANPLAAETGLPIDGDGRMPVDACLRSPADGRIFGAGDCVSWNGTGLAMTGVHAVRQGPVLHGNLLAALAGRPLKAYAPLRRHLAIINLGDGTALAVRGGLWWQGRSALIAKDWIDRRFLRRHAP